MPQCPSKSSAEKARLLAYVAGRLDNQEAAKVALHLRDCKGCMQFVDEQAAVWTLLDDWTPENVQADFNRGVYASIDQCGPEPFAARFARLFTSWIPRPALTIPFATMLLLGSFYLDRPVTKIESQSVVPTAPAVTTNDAEQLKNAFDDLQLLHQLDLVKDEASDASRPM